MIIVGLIDECMDFFLTTNLIAVFTNSLHRMYLLLLNTAERSFFTSESSVIKLLLLFRVG